MEKICVFEIGLLLLDVATREITDSLYNVMGVMETGLPFIAINYNVVNAKF